MKRLVIIALWLLLTPMVLVSLSLGAMFLHFTSLPGPMARTALAVVFVLGSISLFVFVRPVIKAVGAYAALFASIFAWYHLIPASNARQWMIDVEMTAYCERAGDELILHHMRHFAYRTSADYDVKWETQTFDLAGLQTLDVFFCYWGSRDIAHTMFSFGFEDGRFLCVSVETRKEVGEEYSPIASFFKRFELIYVLGDERDLVALRTNVRLEDVYLFPSHLSVQEIRALLDDILARVNSLNEKPEFYRTLRDNCTTSLLTHLNRARRTPISFDVSLIFNGWYPERAYREGQIPNDAPFEEIMRRFAISEKARSSGVGEDFSQRIRAGLKRP